MPKRTLMAVGAHIGDMELSCGGVLAAHALRGDHIITVALTGGEKGNPPHLSVADYRRQKEDEAKAFAERLRGEAIVFPYPDGELTDDDTVCFELCDVIRKYKPTVVMTHWGGSIHKDHEAASQIVKKACFYAALPGFVRDLPPHFAKGPYFAENWEDPFQFEPYVYVVVSEEGFELWNEAIKTHWFAINSPSFSYQAYYAHLMAIRGIEIHQPYAQAFDVSPMEKRLVLPSF